MQQKRNCFLFSYDQAILYVCIHGGVIFIVKQEIKINK